MKKKTERYVEGVLVRAIENALDRVADSPPGEPAYAVVSAMVEILQRALQKVGVR